MNRNHLVLGSGIHVDITPVPEKTPEFEGRLVLVLSTSHITEADDTRLTAWPNFCDDFRGYVREMDVHPMTSGYLITGFQHATPAQRADNTRLSALFWSVVAYAEKRGFDWIRFDGDGPIIKELETNDW